MLPPRINLRDVAAAFALPRGFHWDTPRRFAFFRSRFSWAASMAAKSALLFMRKPDCAGRGFKSRSTRELTGGAFCFGELVTVRNAHAQILFSQMKDMTTRPRQPTRARSFPSGRGGAASAISRRQSADRSALRSR